MAMPAGRKGRRLRLARAIVQAGFLLLFVGMCIALARPSFPRPPASWLLRLDPLAGIASVLASRSVHTLAAFWPAWLILGATLFSGRFFCGWLCPLGTCFDAAGAVKPGRLKYYRLSGEDVKKARDGGTGKRVRMKYVLLVAVLGLSLAGVNLLYFSSPLAIASRGSYLVMAVVLPVFLLALLVVAFVYRPRVWCEEFCPAGALMGLTGKLGSKLHLLRFLAVSKESAACTSCGACYKKCPTGVAEPLTKPDDGALSSAECTLCGDCVPSCPTGALTIGASRGEGARAPAGKPAQEASHDAGFAVTRKDFVYSIGLGAVLVAGYSVGLIKKAATPLRMPGAQDEARFLAVCERCGACMRACPTRCIRPMGLEGGLQKLATPRFVPLKGECIFDSCSQKCEKTCPTKAILQVAPEDVKIGTASVDHTTCKGWRGERCLICMERCRFGAVTNQGLRPFIDPKKCKGCGSCEITCPTSPPSITVRVSGGSSEGGGRRRVGGL
jgi:polyferredoxin